MGLRELEAARLKQLDEGKRDFVEEHALVGLDDIRNMSRDEIIKHFGKKPHKKKPPVSIKKASGKRVAEVPAVKAPKVSPVNDTLVINTLIWQISLLIAGKLEDPIRGNMRSFWYRIVEPFYGSMKLLDIPAGPDLEMALTHWPAFDPDMVELVLEGVVPYNVLLSKNDGEGGAHGAYLIELISKGLEAFVEEGIFTYRNPWQFQDPPSEMHMVGTPPSVIFFMEKEGMWWFCKEVKKTHHITVYASKGQASYLAMEYFSEKLRKHKDHVLWVGAMCDYDPWGLEIAEAFKAKLEHPMYGYPDGRTFTVNLTYLTTIDLFDPDVVEREKRDLGKLHENMNDRVDHWMDETKKLNSDHLGGIHGERFSMHIDNANPAKRLAAVARWVKQALEEQKEVKRKSPRKPTTDQEG